MNPDLVRVLRHAALAAVLTFTAAYACAQAPAAPAAPATGPASPVPSLRNKLSAGDLPSAESIAERWRAQHGEDGPWLVGYSWLARGALLMGEFDRAALYADSTRLYCARRLAAGADLARDGNLETALGAAIEVRAQLDARRHGARAAAARVRAELDSIPGPVALRSRLWKRINLLTLAGQRAPELLPADGTHAGAPTLASLRGRPVMLFLFNYDCGDCRASEPTLERVLARHRGEGLEIVAVTRDYDEPAQRATEQAARDSTWNAVYHGLGPVPVVVSAASMERYGGSSTPTFVFIDRAGTVRGYTPTRLTEAGFEKALAPVLK